MFADIHDEISTSSMGNIVELQSRIMEAQATADRDVEQAALDRTTAQVGAYLDGLTQSDQEGPSAAEQRMLAAGVTAIGSEMASVEEEMKGIRRRLRSDSKRIRTQAVTELRMLERDVQFRLESRAIIQQRAVLRELTQEAVVLHSQASRIELQKRV